MELLLPVVSMDHDEYQNYRPFSMHKSKSVLKINILIELFQFELGFSQSSIVTIWLVFFTLNGIFHDRIRNVRMS